MMKNVKILDCTLRDGGRIIDCAFPDAEIHDVIKRLSEAKVDIIEVGFLRDHRSVNWNSNTTFFTNVSQIKKYIDKSGTNAMYTAFIDFGMFDLHSLDKRDGESIDAIRLGFTKKDYDHSKNDILKYCYEILQKGYYLFVQGVNSLNYSDKELLEVVEMINEVHPYSFGIVDTYGSMYMEDVDRIYGLIDHNLSEDICINFHSHNNYQLSFGFAQEVIKLSKGSRNIIIDGTLAGMGKAAGNLCTELIVEYMVRVLHYDYEIEDILDLIDDVIYKYSLNHRWGYSIPAMMAGIYKAHPNNIIYLTEKFRLDTKDIGNILSMITPDKRQGYDYDNIEQLYIEYSSDKVDDKEAIESLRSEMKGREIVLLVPGDSLNTYRGEIDKYILLNDVIVISVNFVADYNKTMAFYGNQKRYRMDWEKRKNCVTIRSSNIKSDEKDIVVNYHRLIDRGHHLFDNSTIMLLNLMRRIEPSKISIAGFDGFDIKKENNYLDDGFQNSRHLQNFFEANEEIKAMLHDIKETMEGKIEVSFLTPSIYFEGESVL